MKRAFASTADTAKQTAKVVEFAEGVYGYISEFDPNCGFIVGDRGVLAVDTRAVPRMARAFITDIRQVTDKPVTHIFLTHYHAVRVMGASAFGDVNIIATRATADLIEERGAADFESEVSRMPRLFDGVEEVPGLTRPDIIFEGELILRLGGREVHLRHIGRAHTAGDAICHVPDCGVVFGGDIVENRAGIYCGDAYIVEWLETLERLRALKPGLLVPGRGRPASTAKDVSDMIDGHKGFLIALLETVKLALSRGLDLKACYALAEERLTPIYGNWPVYGHILPFAVARARDELGGFRHPRIWTPERDQQLWQAVTEG